MEEKKQLLYQFTRSTSPKNNLLLIHYYLLLSKKTSLLIILFFTSLLSYSQQLTFCESIDSKGNPNNPSKSFIIPATGGFLEALVTMPKQVGSGFVTYDIFQVNDEKKEIFESTIKQILQPNYTWFSKKITFHKTGAYNVYVYDERDRLLCVGRVNIKIQH